MKVTDRNFTRNASGRETCPHCGRYALKTSEKGCTVYIHQQLDGESLGDLVVWKVWDSCSLNHATGLWSMRRPRAANDTESGSPG
jgi:hypothetical protein